VTIFSKKVPKFEGEGDAKVSFYIGEVSLAKTPFTATVAVLISRWVCWTFKFDFSSKKKCDQNHIPDMCNYGHT